MNIPAVQTQKRKEDARFTTGTGRYTTDMRPDGLLHLAFVRSPHAGPDLPPAASAISEKPSRP